MYHVFVDQDGRNVESREFATADAARAFADQAMDAGYTVFTDLPRDCPQPLNDTDIRQRDIDSAAAMLLNGFSGQTSRQWRDAAARWHGRTADVYTRCAEITEARQELAAL